MKTAARPELIAVDSDSASIIHELYQKSPTYFQLIGMEIPTLSDVEREVEALAHDPQRRCCLIATPTPKEGRQVVGYLDYKLHYPEAMAATISLLLIAEEHQGQGFGSLALEHLEGLLRGEVRKLYAVVYGNNPVAQRFWEARGFRHLKDGGPSLRWYVKDLPQA
ncbi:MULTISPECIES: GNAT family N-acetyltransferase [unclassified Meiothermus]|uniref:GNAT family N-acetyltransferase n=1 Tax=unclassified Meiothermus TaxID=370471 RepID=UPI000D7C492F|nr:MULTISPECIES: GNAT family N-acetyltransferase [unclassified Meiothermus]PZA08698.1 GNAT family N-acetyltransferase [Meiothermus sp. Pnk-1]RYM40683.1 GNAT family N-acetyltransferase [Meiothermus sp. PNK-Is4]